MPEIEQEVKFEASILDKFQSWNSHQLIICHLSFLVLMSARAKVHCYHRDGHHHNHDRVVLLSIIFLILSVTVSPAICSR